MRNKFFKGCVLATAIVVSCAASAFAACTPTEEEPEKSYYTEWSYDGANHWHDCNTLDPADAKDKAAHSLGSDGACTECGWKAAACQRVCPECGQCIDVNSTYNAMLVDSVEDVTDPTTDFGTTQHTDEVLCGHDLASNYFYAANAVIEGTAYNGALDWLEEDEEGNPVDPFVRAHGTADSTTATYTFVIYSNVDTTVTMRVRGSRASAATKTYNGVKKCPNVDYPKFTDVMKLTVNDEEINRDAVTLHGGKADIGWTNLGCIKLHEGMNVIILANSSANATNANRKGYNLSIVELLSLPGVDLTWTPKDNGMVAS